MHQYLGISYALLSAMIGSRELWAARDVVIPASIRARAASLAPNYARMAVIGRRVETALSTSEAVVLAMLAIGYLGD